MSTDKKMTPKEYTDIVLQGSMPSLVPQNLLKQEYKKIQQTMKEAAEYHLKKNRPLNILVTHSSGRHAEFSAAQEMSNSQFLLEKGLDVLKDRKDVEIERVHLRSPEYNRIEACNNCVASSSALCGFPCDCYPISGEGAQLIYPLLMKCDVWLVSTGVKQSAMDSRLKLLVERMICLDGGYWREELEDKGPEFRAKMIELSTKHPVAYDQRLFGRVAAYFISTKDEVNSFKSKDAGNMTLSYSELVATSLRDGNEDYGFSHPDPYYSVFAANPDEDYAYDKKRLTENTEVHSKAQKLVLSAVSLAEQYRKEGYPAFKAERKNRT